MYSNALQNIVSQSRLRTAEKDRDYTKQMGPAKIASSVLSGINSILRSGIKTKRAVQHWNSRPTVYGFDPYGTSKAQAAYVKTNIVPEKYSWVWFNNYFGKQPLVSDPNPRQPIRIPQLSNVIKGGK